ncbi:MAG: HDOD domain-containing protein [Elusimicrobiota bacterium]|nr:HDOD domain-containing protein [Endomicrobiia bacterium]MDW8166631.1 HDOD domain-containing protein [Elusimicrobiota bacterium]
MPKIKKDLSGENITEKDLTKEIVDEAFPNLKPFFSTIVDILRILDNEKVFLNVLSENILKDERLTALVLAKANSFFYGFHGKITTINQALLVLGLREIRNIVLSCLIDDCFPDENSISSLMRKKSFLMGICCKYLSQVLFANDTETHSEMQILGMIHELGSIILMNSRYSEEYKNFILESLRESYSVYEVIDYENKKFQTNHVKVAVEFMKRWKFPQVYIDVFSLHVLSVKDCFGMENVDENLMKKVCILKLADRLCSFSFSTSEKKNGNIDEISFLIDYLNLGRYEFLQLVRNIIVCQYAFS